MIHSINTQSLHGINPCFECYFNVNWLFSNSSLRQLCNLKNPKRRKSKTEEQHISKFNFKFQISGIPLWDGKKRGARLGILPPRNQDEQSHSAPWTAPCTASRDGCFDSKHDWDIINTGQIAFTGDCSVPMCESLLNTDWLLTVHLFGNQFIWVQSLTSVKGSDLKDTRRSLLSSPVSLTGESKHRLSALPLLGGWPSHNKPKSMSLKIKFHI